MKSCAASEYLPIALETPHCTPILFLDVILPTVFDFPPFNISNRLDHLPGTERALADLMDIRFDKETARGSLFN